MHGGICWQRRDATGRQGRGVAHDFTQPLGFRTGAPEEIAPEAAYLAFGLEEPVQEVNRVRWVITGAGHGVKADPVRDELFFLLTLVRVVNVNLGGIIHQLVPFIENILAVADLTDIQLSQPPRKLNGCLVCDHVSNLVPQQSGKLIFILGKRNDPAEDVNAAARCAEGIQVRRIDNDKTVMHFGGRKLGQQSLAKLLQIAIWVFHHVEVLAEGLVNDVTQPLFLLIAKKIGASGGRQVWHGARRVLLRRPRLGLRGYLKKRHNQNKERNKMAWTEHGGPLRG